MLSVIIPVGFFYVGPVVTSFEWPWIIPWLWIIPVGFFGGWSLIFLPGAIAAHEFPPRLNRFGFWARRIVAWVAPAVVALAASALASNLF